MRALIALIVVVCLVGVGVALSPTVRAEWNSAPASDCGKRRAGFALCAHMASEGLPQHNRPRLTVFDRRRDAGYLGSLYAFRLRVTAAFLAAADRLAAGLAEEAAPPNLPPLCAAGWPVAFPRPDPPSFLPPPSSLLTVAQARRSASSSGTPRTLIAFRDVVCFALLLVRVLRFVAAWHACLLRCGDHNQPLRERFQGVGLPLLIKAQGRGTFVGPSGLSEEERGVWC